MVHMVQFERESLPYIDTARFEYLYVLYSTLEYYYIQNKQQMDGDTYRNDKSVNREPPDLDLGYSGYAVNQSVICKIFGI